MPKNDQKQQNTGQIETTDFTALVALIGFFGGLIWGFVYFIAYYLNLTDVGPALILNPWALGEWKNKILGQLIGIIAISMISIGIAFLYRALFAKFKSITLSLLFGVSLWGFVFYLLKPMFPDLKPLSEIGWNTIVTTVCIFLLYGLFIGYSISFHYEERQTAYSKK